MKKSTARLLAVCYPILLLTMPALAQEVWTKDVVGNYHYRYTIPYHINEGKMLFDETGIMKFYNDGHGLDSACQVYTLTMESGEEIRWTFNFVNQNKWKVSADTLIYSGTAETFEFELVQLDVYDVKFEQWAHDYAEKLISSVKTHIADTDYYILSRKNNSTLLFIPTDHPDRILELVED